ncbi:AAA-domain-containing protein [Coemansia reversa NRRL 1564]|uniref:AAA-domain-containing protein n=1 Tax=Coemansia reversa (strain ATCC 12441 / NRRL 1564) TaxID=763665 RepID=A0A2G5BDA0_COERN|nr:AAA-domain-containing protein [Coemansia reversa NRRL 1564]|eukprot:PIA16962.1 AAA-domain-containing protein [Coemansia reversa NRRL 1564]
MQVVGNGQLGSDARLDAHQATRDDAHADAPQAIGGLKREVAEVQRLVDAALRAPHVFATYGLVPPRGVLLAGPPGTGKTLVARSVAAASGAAVHVINGAEVVGKHSGDAEARLRDVFAAARHQRPSVVLIDEIDALCPRRQGGGGAARVVATLLTLLDGADAGDGVVVIGATNRPDALDAALRRPGRFDREIVIGVPDALGRRAILSARLAATPHALRPAQLDTLAATTHGFVGADVAALVREAAVAAVRRHSTGIGTLEVTWPDIDVARRAVRPSALREVALDVPHVRWDDIGGQATTKQQLREAVEWPLRHPDAFARMSVRPPKGVLLYGPPGCSKTLTARALASETGLNFLAVRGPELFSKWVGESEKAVRAVFQRARAAAPAIVFFDEFDALAVRRGATDGSSVADRVLSQLLAELDGIEPLVRVIVIAATNRPDVIDPALLRPGRIDRLIYVAPPDLSAREHILQLRLTAVPAAPDVSASLLAQRCEGFSGAEVAALCQDAAVCAMAENPDASRVEMRHFDACLVSHKCRISPEMLRFYADFHAAA